MPAQTATADQLTAEGVIRTCTRCGFQGPLTPENFFHRVDRSTGETTWVDRRCQTCRRAVDAANRAARRAGQGVRARRSAIETRRFGIEIEFVGASHSAVVREMTSRGVACAYEGYNHSVPSGWKIVTDASVSGGYELVSPPLSGQDGFDQLRKACEALSAAGARVDRRCGLHVHHDARDLDGAAIVRLFRGWRSNQPATNGLVAPSRRNSQWAAPLSVADVDRVAALPNGRVTRDIARRFLSYVDRYRSLNIAPYVRQGTIEVRQHQGTIAYAKIAAWVAFGQAFFAAAAAGEIETAADAAGLVDVLSRTGRLPAAHAETLRRRAAHFAGRQPVAA